MRTIALEYHDVVAPGAFDASGFPGAAAATYKMAASRFEAHLHAVSDAVGAARWLLPDLAPSDGRLPVVLTFDDGGRSARAEIADRLERLGWRGHFFLATDFLGAPTFLSAADLRELRSRGHVVGSHSCSHPLRMADCADDDLRREWLESTAVLADVLGEPVSIASVPGGAYSRRVAEAAAAAGIRWLFTSEPVTRVHAVNGCRVIGRFTMRRSTAPEVAGAIARGRVAPRLAQWLAWNAKKVLKRGGPAYLRARELLLRRSAPDVT